MHDLSSDGNRYKVRSQWLSGKGDSESFSPFLTPANSLIISKLNGEKRAQTAAPIQRLQSDSDLIRFLFRHGQEGIELLLGEGRFWCRVGEICENTLG